MFTAPMIISANAPVVHNGLILTASEDYSYTANQVTFFTAPAATDVLAIYQ